MTADYIVAYANDSTNFEWKIIGISDSMYNAIHHVNAIKSEMTKSSLAIFTRHTSDPMHWSDKRPTRIYNKRIIDIGKNPNGLISSAVSGIINSRESDWF